MTDLQKAYDLGYKDGFNKRKPQKDIEERVKKR